MEILYVAAYHTKKKKKNLVQSMGHIMEYANPCDLLVQNEKTHPTSPPSHRAFNGTTLKQLKYSNAIFSWDIITTM